MEGLGHTGDGVAPEPGDRDFIRDTLRQDYMLTRQQQRDLLNTLERNLAVLIAGLSLAVAFGRDVVVILLPLALTIIGAYQLHQLGDMQMFAARRHCVQLRLKQLLATPAVTDEWTLPDDADVGDTRSYNTGYLMLVALGVTFAISAALSVVTAFRVWPWALAAGVTLLVVGAGWFLAIAACEMLLALPNSYAAYRSKGWPVPAGAGRRGGFERMVRATLQILLMRRPTVDQPPGRSRRGTEATGNGVPSE